MSNSSITDLVRTLGELPMLQPAQKLEMDRLQNRMSDSKALVQHLVQRGWLTAYQGKHLLQGQASQLILGAYVILDSLGEGGMGQIYKARHPGLNRMAAVKVLRPELVSDTEMLHRFLREIKLASQLTKHIHLVHAFDAGPVGATYFLAMEYIEGIDLDRLVHGMGPLPVPRACDYIRQAALGLQHAHEHGLVHRDIKPANLLVTPRPGKPSADGSTVKVLDLGLARLHGKGTATGQTVLTLTSDGTMTMGTVDYMAPEQALDLHRADIRADVYSLGCTFYFLLTGKPPFGGGPLAVKLMRHQQTEPPDLKELRPDVPDQLIPIVRRMLAKRPDDRYQTPGDIATALAKLSPPNAAHAAARTSGPSPANPLSLWKWGPVLVIRLAKAVARGSWQTLRRWPRMVLGTVAGLLLSAVMIGWLLGPRSPFGPGPNTPITELAPATGLGRLRARAGEPGGNVPALWRDIVSFRMQHSGTRDAAAAAELQRSVPSPLDMLDPAQIKDRSKMPAETVAIIEGHRLAEQAIRFSPDGCSVALCGEPTHLELAVYDLAGPAPKLLASLTGHTAPLFAIAFSSDGKQVASGSADKTVRLWDLTERPPRALRVLEGHTGTIHCLAFSPDGKTLVSGSDDKTIRMWSLGAAQPAAPVVLPIDRGVRSLDFTQNGKTLASGCTGGAGSVVYLWDLTAQPPKVRRTFPAGVGSLAMSPDGNFMSGGELNNGNALLLNLAGPEPNGIKLGHWHDGGVRVLRFTPDGKLLFSADGVGRFRWWDAVSGTSASARNVSLSSPCVDLAPDGRHVAAAPRGNMLYILRFPQAVAPSR